MTNLTNQSGLRMRKDRALKPLRISPEVVNFCDLLNQSGYQAYLVGGAVRDAILGIKPSDIDLATDALPDQIQDLASHNKIKFSSFGECFGGTRLSIKPFSIMVTTFRRETFRGGKTTVSFTNSLQQDAWRREFTINAIYANHYGKIYDPFGGVADLINGTVRFVGNPETRLEEDVFRILRYFRFRAFFARLDRSIPNEVKLAICRHASSLAQISRERIGNEMMKILSAKSVCSILNNMQETRVLEHCLLGCQLSKLFNLEWLENITKVKPDPIRRLVVLRSNNPKHYLRLCRQDLNQLNLINSWIEKKVHPAELAYRLGEEDALNVVLALSALNDNSLEPSIRDLIAEWSRRQFPLFGSDLNHKFQGQNLGAKLKQLEKKWLDSEMTLDRHLLLASLQSASGEKAKISN